MQYILTYINNCNKLFQTGHATEHSYRGDLQKLLEHIINDSNIKVKNEAKRIQKVELLIIISKKEISQ